ATWGRPTTLDRRAGAKEGLATMTHLIFAADPSLESMAYIGGAILLVVVGLIGLVIFFTFIHLWIQSLLYGARIGFSQLIRMRLGKVDYAMIVRQKVALVQAGVRVTTEELESDYQSRGNVARTGTAVVSAA